MTKRIPVTSEQNIWFDAEQVDDSDLTLEQTHNATIQTGIINNHFGTGAVPEVLEQNILFDSSLETNFLDGVAVSAQNQPADTNYGNQLEITLTDSLANGKKTVKVCVIGLDFNSELQFETFDFKTNETQVGCKHFATIELLLFNDFIGNPSYSLNLGGKIVIKEANPFTLSRNPKMVAQDLQPNLFFRDFFVDGSTSLFTLLTAALPYYNIDTLGIYTGSADQYYLLADDITTQVGEKFVATTNNIQKLTLLMSVRNLVTPADLAWTGELILSIYPLQSTIECSTDIVPNLAIDYAPMNTPIAQVSLDYNSLLADGVLLDSVPQPVDFVFSNSSAEGGNSISVGDYYAFSLKRAGTADKCDIILEAGNDLIDDSRVTSYSGSVWVDIPEQDLWFQIWHDSAKVSDGQGYDSGNGMILPKTMLNTTTQATEDYCLKDIQFTGNDVYRAVISATVEKSDQVTDQRTGQPVYSRKEFVPSVSLLNSIDIASLISASEPLIIGSISDKNNKSFDAAQAALSALLHSATVVNDEILVKIITDTTDTGRYSTSVTALESNLLLGNFNDAKIYPNGINTSTYYRVSEAKLCSMMVGDVDGDGVITSSDLDLLESYYGFDMNTGLPEDSTVTTDGYTTTYTNGYNTLTVPFTNGFGLSFQLVRSDGYVVASGSDGIIVANPNDNRLAQFTSSNVSFSTIIGLTDFILVINDPSVDANYGGFDITGIDSVSDVITLRKVYLTGDVFAQMLRADINGDFAITEADGYLLESYINRYPYVGTPSTTYPAPTTDPYTKIGTLFNVVRFKVQKYVDRSDDYSSVITGRATTIHPEQDIFQADGYFHSHDFYNNPAILSFEKKLTWQDFRVITGYRTKTVPSVFTSLSGYNVKQCTLDGTTCNTYPLPIDFDSGTIDFYAPDNVIIGSGEIKRPNGGFYKVDFEMGTIVLEIPNGLYGNEKSINLMQDFIVSEVDGTTGLPTGLTRLGYPAMRYADCSFVESSDLANDKVRFSVAVQSFSPNTNGEDDDGYTGAIVDGKMGVSMDYSTGLLTLNFTNLYEDAVMQTLSTKVQISVYLKKGGFNNTPLFVESAQVRNMLSLISIFNGPVSGGPSALVDLEVETTGILPIVNGGTGLNAAGAYGSVLMSSGSALSYQFIADLPGTISSTSGVADAGKMIKTDSAGKLDPSFIYMNPVYIYGVAGTITDGYDASPHAIGALEFTYDDFVATGISSVKFEAIIETTNASNAAEIRLYDLTSGADEVLSGANDYLSSTSTTPELVVSDDLSTALDDGTISHLYEIRLVLNPTTGAELATCKMARLVVTYT